MLSGYIDYENKKLCRDVEQRRDIYIDLFIFVVLIYSVFSLIYN